MSADTTTAILKTPEGSRVSIVQAVERLYDCDAGYIEAWFGEKEYLSDADALDEARILETDASANGMETEYGIRFFELDANLNVLRSCRESQIS